MHDTCAGLSTIVEIIFVCQTVWQTSTFNNIYNSRNYFCLLDFYALFLLYSHLQQQKLFLSARQRVDKIKVEKSTIVEIIFVCQTKYIKGRKITHLQQQKLFLSARLSDMSMPFFNLQQQKLFLSARLAIIINGTVYIYNSRNYFCLLDENQWVFEQLVSTIVEIIFVCQTCSICDFSDAIYNSRNYFCLLDVSSPPKQSITSTIVEIIFVCQTFQRDS